MRCSTVSDARPHGPPVLRTSLTGRLWLELFWRHTGQRHAGASGASQARGASQWGLPLHRRIQVACSGSARCGGVERLVTWNPDDVGRRRGSAREDNRGRAAFRPRGARRSAPRGPGGRGVCSPGIVCAKKGIIMSISLRSPPPSILSIPTQAWPSLMSSHSNFLFAGTN